MRSLVSIFFLKDVCNCKPYLLSFVSSYIFLDCNHLFIVLLLSFHLFHGFSGEMAHYCIFFSVTTRSWTGLIIFHGTLCYEVINLRTLLQQWQWTFTLL